jgi:hypothetical protein
MGVTDEGQAQKMTMEMALMLRRTVQTIDFMMESLKEKHERHDPVSKAALSQFSLTIAAELSSYDFLDDSESCYVLKMVREILPRA